MTKEEMKSEIRRLAYSAQEINYQDVLAGRFGDYENFVIYGAGNAGLQFVDFLNSVFSEPKIDCFLDQNADVKPEYLGYPVYTPDALCLNADFRENSVVVLALSLSLGEYAELDKKLRSLGWKKTVNPFAVYPFAVYPFAVYPFDRSIFVQNIDSILSCFDLMADDHSRDCFLSVFKSHATLQYSQEILSQGMVAYVDVDVPFRSRYRSFVDCGAYTGDTLEELVKYHKIESYFGFEPDMNNYIKLSETVKKCAKTLSRAVCLPLGVGDQNEYLTFNATGGAGSRVCKEGKAILQVVRLDDVFPAGKGGKDLMIKMDIEGAEIAALNGATKTILALKPDLAISVYHRISDLWEIPLMLKMLVPEYSFYLRSHWLCATDTVIYATIAQTKD
jgi:FkbM family methyltransferase